MSQSLRHFLRLRLWTDKPPSLRRVVTVFSVVLVCAAIYSLERRGGWPDELTRERPAKIKLQE